MRVLLKDEEGFDDRSNEPPGWGTGMHGLISRFMLNGEVPGTASDVLAAWTKEMANRSTEVSEDITSYASSEVLLALAEEMRVGFVNWITQFWQTTGRHYETVAVEERVMRGLGVLPSGRDVWISGAPDWVFKVTDEGQVIDWKTAGRGWKKGKADSNAVQLLCYSWLSEHHVDVSRGTFVVYDRSKGEWTWSDKSFQITPERTELALRSMWTMGEAIDSGHAVANPFATGGFGDGRGWHCSPKYCGAWNICEFKALPGDGKEIESRPATMTWGD